ncbi:MAG: hypothetical protein ACRC8S_18455 [Fimbriiglobus sp.]
MARFRKYGLPVAAMVFALNSVGCVQSWVSQRMEDKYQHNKDFTTPVMPPLQDGKPAPVCEDAPSDLEVLRALPRGIRGIPFIYEEHRDGIEISKSRIVDKIDPPRFFPLVGPAQLHHCHWECVVRYKETVQSDHPIPFQTQKSRVQVVYIDKDHLHLYVGPNPDMQREILNEMTKY